MSPKPILIAISLSLAGVHAAAAAQPVRVGEFDNWGVYSYKTSGRTVCYALSTPTKMEPAGIDHGRNFFIVGPGSARGEAYVPEARMGYQLKPGSTVAVSVGDRKFEMSARDSSAWTRKESDEAVMIGAMKGGSEMVIEATSRRGTATRYTYSLAGVTAALQKVGACR